ncbi:pantetheine-phosphate adenylyltransferase [Pseudovibrio brasiliensis]|uniref:Phosphopantetheine adenylyltransferase n=1 Tax=Pseudovibrio brasiliensis TaxID=1898042 RepID=A0ABX8AJX1_9HYPH|nr:pantetheine-phosphate adenylyltransferase [Pseudovibrio brasiliensis]QUS53976.1 pantetheine-phosphate adenylyltransferase [Pseudovibrio brasiliensis]
MKRIALYPGSFDPMTHGHLDILEQSLVLADEVVVAIGIQASKAPLFSFEERVELIRLACEEQFGEENAARIRTVSFTGLVVDAAREHGSNILVRGLRDSTDLNYEMQMAGMNGAMAPDIKTVFFPSSPVMRPITATLVRQIAKMGGDYSSFVPKCVEAALKKRFEIA